MSQRLSINFDQLDTVKNNSLFSGLTKKEKADFLKDGGIYKYPRKSFLFRETDPVHFVYMVCSGIVQEYRTTLDGREITVNIHKAEDVFCKAGLFLKEAFYHTNARAVDNACIMELPIERFRENLKKYDLVATRLISSLAQHAFTKQAEVEQQATMTAPQLLALFLRQTCDSHGLDPHGFTLPYKKSLIASRLGMEIETLSRALPRLKEYGIIVKGAHVLFTDLRTTAQNAVKDFSMPARTLKAA